MHAPGPDCPLCPRLATFRAENRSVQAAWHNAPVPSFGSDDAWLLIVGLAPGRKGANRTGRPFTGDHAGTLLYETLIAYGLARGHYHPDGCDNLTLVGCRITNAVRCVPPANAPTTEEIGNCNRFLATEIAALADLRAVLALGGIAHTAVLTALGLGRRHAPFRHGAVHRLPDGRDLVDSYHCSRLNTNTGRLTAAMFAAVFDRLMDAHVR